MPKTNRRPTVQIVILLGVALSLSVGCAPLWNRLRENERQSAVNSARSYSKRGACSQALRALDRATSRLDIGPYGQEATLHRMRCYERQERHAAARAHQRLLDDFFPAENPAYPAADGSSVFRAPDIPKLDYSNPPSAIEFMAPQYTEAARRSYITGRVVVYFQLGERDQPKSIRVLEMPHPLLASWAIEAVEGAKRKRKEKAPLIAPGGHYLATFAFEYRWADSGQQIDSDAGDF